MENLRYFSLPKLTINFEQLAIGMDRFKYSVNRMAASWQGKPVPPMPKKYFYGTAREYRAARRKYHRDLNAQRKANR